MGDLKTRIPEVKAWDDGTRVMEKNCVPIWHLGCAAINALEAEVASLLDQKEIEDSFRAAEREEFKMLRMFGSNAKYDEWARRGGGGG